MGIPVEFVDSVSWQEREKMFDEGSAHIAVLCGLYYVRRKDCPNPSAELIAAPVMKEQRYQNQPVYYSEVVVRHESSISKFSDLQGASWAFNEPNSHSGYNLICHELASRGETTNYFGKVIESGAHETSLKLVFQGKVDAAAIDSTVLKTEFEKRPEIQKKLKIVETLGPSSIPPIVCSPSLPDSLKKELKEVLCHLHENPKAAKILSQSPFLRFAPVKDSDYDDIRNMDKVVQVSQFNLAKKK